MPRKSAASLAIVTPLKPSKYPTAPAGLSARQAELWTATTRSKPSDWWDAGSLPVLQALVGHIETLQMIEKQFATDVDLSKDEALGRMDKLSRLRDRESKAVSTLSAKLRLTQQSRYTAGSAATAARRSGTRPWDIDPDDPAEEFFSNAFARNGVRP